MQGYPIKNKEDLVLTRKKLKQILIDKNNYKVEEVLNWNDNNYLFMGNLRSITKLNIIHKDGVNSNSYFFKPIKSNSKLLIFHQGHSGNFVLSKDILDFFNTRGYSIMAFQMPLIGDNPGIINSRNEIVKDHEVLVKFNTEKKSFLSLFTTPIIVALDHILLNNNYKSISMTGISGGGWTTVMVSAIDQRIENSFPVAGSLPLSLVTYDIADIENVFKPFYAKYPYLDLYLLGSTGIRRKQIQINILNDPCCFSGRRSDIYKEYLSNLSKDLNGNFSVKIMEGFKHKIDKETARYIHENI